MGDGVKLFKGDIVQGGLLEEVCVGFVLFMMGVVFVVDESMFKVVVDDYYCYVFWY